jgi:peroxiredoxin (alkyl hydroperoxide reductase subunit C)
MLIRQSAPDFTATAVMPDNTFKSISLSDYRGKYTVLFFYPLDFTFVCPTEIIAFHDRLEEFKKRNAEMLGVSVDSEFSHLAWKETPRKQGGIGKIDYPLIADLDKSIARKYDVLADEGFALRGLFLIDKTGIVRHALVNDAPIGRSIDEALRVLEALIFTETHGEVCPANWHQGETAITPTSQGIADYLGKQV